MTKHEPTTSAGRKHGLSCTPEYRAWQQLRLRCSNPKHAAFGNYGGRGITVCASWAGSVERFVADMGPRPTAKHEIDRIDNDAGYWCGKCPECIDMGRSTNCRWVTREENDRNRRSNRMLTLNGETLALAAWAERTGISAGVISKRIASGWAPERALTTPARPKTAGAEERVVCAICEQAFVRRVTKNVARVTCSSSCAKALAILRRAKLSIAEVEAARAARREGATVRALAERFGISVSGMKKVLLGKKFRTEDPQVIAAVVRANFAQRVERRVA